MGVVNHRTLLRWKTVWLEESDTKWRAVKGEEHRCGCQDEAGGAVRVKRVNPHRSGDDVAPSQNSFSTKASPETQADCLPRETEPRDNAGDTAGVELDRLKSRRPGRTGPASCRRTTA